METKEILIQMLKEDTGRHMLDSGYAYGRNFEKNQDVDFESLPAATVDFSYNEIDIQINLFHWLNSRLTYDENVDKLFQEYCSKSEDNYFEDADHFVKSLNGTYYTVNTYNEEFNLLSQTIQYTIVELEDDVLIDNKTVPEGIYVFLMIHGGCDTRGGYTTPRVFTLDEEEGMYLGSSEVTLSCKAPTVCQQDLFSKEDTPISRTHIWDTYNGGYAWEPAEYQEDGNLNDYDFSEDIEDLGKGKIVVIDGKGYCPLCGEELEVFVNF